MTDKGGKPRIVFYGARWCPHCRRAKQYLADHGVDFRYLDIDRDPAAAARLEKMSGGNPVIPTIIIDREMMVNPDNPTLRRILGISEKNRRRVYDVLVVGGGAAGLTAALYLQRERFETAVLEKISPGGNAALTDNIENYPGFQDISGLDLMETMAGQAARYGARIESGVEVLSLARDGNCYLARTNDGLRAGQAIIIATGSVYRTLGIPGEADLVGAGVHFCATCDGPFYRDREVIVIGGGNSALEEGLNLARYCRRVTVVSRGKKLSATRIYQEKARQAENMTILLDRESVAMKAGENGRFRALVTRDGASGRKVEITADGVFVFIGMTPNTSFLEGFLDLDDDGRIIAGGLNETSRKGIFAAGDCRSGAIAQVASATGEGVVASYGARDYLAGRELPARRVRGNS